MQCLLLSACTGAALASEEQPVQFSGKTLTNRQITLPDIESPTSALIVSFSRQAGNQAEPWNVALLDDARWQGSIHNVIVLQGAPRFVRALITRGIRSDLTPAQQEHFVIVTQDAADWREHLGVQDDAVVHVALYHAGRACASATGSFTEAALDALVTGCQRP